MALSSTLWGSQIALPKKDGVPMSTKDPLLPTLTFADFCARLTVKERAYAEKRSAAMEGDPARQRLWQHLAARLLALAGHSAKVNSTESIQFYAPDGKYRMQIFALQDIVPEYLSIHCRDTLDTLLEKKLLHKPATGSIRYGVRGTTETLAVERVLPQTAEHPAAFRDLLSWNRKCMRIDVGVSSSPALLNALDEMLVISLPTVKPKA